MPNLFQTYENYEKPGMVIQYRVASAKLFKGGFVGVLSTGYLAPLSPATAGMRFMGLAMETVDNVAGAVGERACLVGKVGTYVFEAAAGYAPTVADIGREVYAASDWEVQTAMAGLPNPYKVGTVVALETTSNGLTGVRVRVDNYTN